eukprot:Clim_evm45s147 gene=Clim_evmTU45s147
MVAYEEQLQGLRLHNRQVRTSFATSLRAIIDLFENFDEGEDAPSLDVAEDPGSPTTEPEEPIGKENDSGDVEYNETYQKAAEGLHQRLAYMRTKYRENDTQEYFARDALPSGNSLTKGNSRQHATGDLMEDRAKRNLCLQHGLPVCFECAVSGAYEY